MSNEQIQNRLSDPEALPNYLKIDPETMEQETLELTNWAEREIEAFQESQNEYSWDSIVAPLEEIRDTIAKFWSPISHLNAVANTPELRKAHDACLQHISRFESNLMQSTKLCRAFKDVKSRKDFVNLDIAQRKVVDDTLLKFKLAGVDLLEIERKQLVEISERLALLSSEYSSNVLDASDDWKKHITDAALLDGMPEVNVQVARQEAITEGKEGYLLTLAMPSYFSVMAHVRNRALREEVFNASVTRSSEIGPSAGRFDNTAIMLEILELRRTQSKMLGFENFAEYSVALKMARTSSEVNTFLTNLYERALPSAKNEVEAMRQFAKREYKIDQLQQWDSAFIAERLKETLYEISDEDLRPYFPIATVLDGLFQIVNSLYGIRVRRDNSASTWHDDVQYFEMLRDNRLIAKFYLDPYARPNKRGGAWMADCVVRREVGNLLQLPVAYLTCNFNPPTTDKPALLTHREVVTLFHEFGHGLHHMLTEQKHYSVSGINGVEWDAVELPSQFMENYCWEKKTVGLISGHFETGESLPDEFLEKLVGARNFNAGLQMVRQLEFGLFDLHLHQADAEIDVLALWRDIRERGELLPVVDYERFPWSFSHIFAGGYAAGYYSYLWAEVLSADAFSRFEEEGVLNAQVGAAFLHEVLQMGGSRTAPENFQAFRGRKANNAAFLRHAGLVEA